MKYHYIIFVRNKYFVGSYNVLFMTNWDIFYLFLYYLGIFWQIFFWNIYLQCTLLLNAIVGNVLSFL